MVLQEVRETFGGRFLQHLLQDSGCTAVADKDTMVFSNRGVEPQAITHYISIGDVAKTLSSTDIHIATDYHRG